MAVAAPPGTAASNDALTGVRLGVRGLLASSPEFRSLTPEQREQLAESLVRVCHFSEELRREEAAADEQLAVAQSQPEFGAAAQQAATVTQRILNAVSFPRFVTDLLNGVFKAIIDSNIQQMDAFVDLLRNVSASLDGFADTNVGADRARQWLADRYPASFTLQGGDDPSEPRDPSDPPPERTLRMADGGQMPTEAALRTDLGLGPDDALPTGDPDRSLVPLARRQLARQRQSMLSTMVMLGMQRIVVDTGRITAAMRFHIDTHSAASEDRGSTLDERNTISASGSYGFGPWGVSATMTNNLAYVSTQREQSTEEMNTDLDLNSSVEVVFKSDYLPLNRMATAGQAAAIRSNSLNPEGEAAAAATERTAREAGQRTAEQARSAETSTRLSGGPPTPAAAPPAAGQPGSREAADAARQRASQGSSGGSGSASGAASNTAPSPGRGSGSRLRRNCHSRCWCWCWCWCGRRRANRIRHRSFARPWIRPCGRRRCGHHQSHVSTRAPDPYGPARQAERAASNGRRRRLRQSRRARRGTRRRAYGPSPMWRRPGSGIVSADRHAASDANEE